MKKIFGNIPAVPFAIFMIIAVAGIILSSQDRTLTGLAGAGACIQAGNVSKNPSLGPAGDFGECCTGLIEISGAPLSAYYLENCTSNGEWVGSGIICSACGNGICEEWEHKCNCPHDCGGAAISLKSPKNDTTIGAPANITFKWTPNNFTYSGLKCLPVAQLATNENVNIYPVSSDGNFTLLNCKNNDECEWKIAVDSTYIGQWQWAVYCGNNETDFSGNWTNVTLSKIWDLEINVATAANATKTIDLVSPKDNKTYVAPITVPFQWIPRGFATPVCIPYAAISEDFFFYPGSSANTTVFIKCVNNRTCSWNSSELNDSYAGKWQWVVYCGNSESDFGTQNYKQSPSVWNFEIKSMTGCSSNWTITDWQPLTCKLGEAQTRVLTDKGNCKIRPSTINCSSWDQGNSICIETRPCPAMSPSGLARIKNWEPCPCNAWEKQSAVYQYSNGTNLTQLRDCRNEDWTVNWSRCVNGTQKGAWFDKNNAETECNKSAEIPQRACVEISWKKLMPWALAGIAAIIMIISSVVFAKKKAYVRAAKTIKEAGKPEEPKKHEEYSELKGYVKKARARGFSKDQIKQQLIKAGWPEDVVIKSLE
jgi:hypothetical protein